MDFACASEITAENVIILINQERRKAGLDPLVENKKLSNSAQEKAEDMIKKNYFAHTSPEGLTPWYWIERNGYGYKFAGENLAINFRSAEKQNEALMGSETHRKNILGKQFNEIGVAVIKGFVDDKESIVTVQQFGNRGVVVALPEKREIKAELQEMESETKNKMFIYSGVAAGENLFGKGAGIGNSILKRGEKWIESFSFSASAVAFVAMLFLIAVIAGIFEVLRRIHAVDFSKRKTDDIFQALSFQEREKIPSRTLSDSENTQIIYLHQMKRLE